MKSVHFLFLIFLLHSFNSKSQSTWQQLTTNTTKSLTTIQCFAKDTLFVFGDDIVLFSANGGTTFTPYTNNFAAPQAGYFRTIDTGFAPNGTGNLMLSSNGGTSWSLSVSNCGCLITSLKFCNQQVGLYGSTTGLFRTDDGGLTWSVIPSMLTSRPSTIRSLHDSSFVFVYNKHFYKSNDGGISFTIDTLNYGSSYSLTGLSFIDDSIGYTASGDGKVLKTLSQGKQWTLVQDIAQPIRDIYFIDEQNGFAITGTLNNVIYKTSNGGLNWTLDYTGSASTSLREFAYDGKSLFVIGDDGVAMKLETYPTRISTVHLANISLYPNPARERLYFSSIKCQRDISILQLDGKVIQEYTNYNFNSLEISQLASGTYLLKIKDNDGDYYSHFVKE